MSSTARILIVLLCGMFAGGCATVNHMAFDKRANSVDVTTKSVVLVAIDISRPDKSRFELEPFVVKTEKPHAQSKRDRQNFTVDKNADTVKTEDGHTLYLARMALEPGQYQLLEVMGFARAFPINAAFLVPLLSDFNVPPRSVVYAGHITAALRPREPGEFRAGPIVPLIDQRIAGISNSTWDITLDDRSGSDLPLFRQTFKAVESAQIATSPLTPFDRMAAQRWWDNNSPKDTDQAAQAAAPSAGSGAADAKP